jgi:hypothetical protein
MVSALHVLLTILKILGILVVSILGIALCILLLVLFVPVRYKCKGSFGEKDIFACARATWLFHFISACASFDNEKKLWIRVKLLGISLYDSLKQKNKSEEKHKKQKKKKNINEDIKEEKEEIKEDVSEELGKPDIEIAPEVKVAEEETETPDNEAEPKIHSDKKSIFLKILKKINNIKFTIRKICDTIQAVRSNLQYYVKLMKLESTKKAFESCKKQLLRVLKMVAPRKYDVQLHLGFDDPAKMGEVLSIWGMLYPWHMGKINIQPEFEQSVMEGTFLVKGRISIFVIVKSACILFFDRNIKLFIKRLKK